jgi:hypothetical protein
VLYYSAIFGKIQANSPALALIPGNLAFTDNSLTNLGFGSGQGGYPGFLFPQGRNVTQWGLVDDLSITKGNHSFKNGRELPPGRHQRFYRFIVGCLSCDEHYISPICRGHGAVYPI